VLFNDTFSSTCVTTLSGSTTVTDKMIRMCKLAAMMYCKEPPQHLPWRTQTIMINPHEASIYAQNKSQGPHIWKWSTNTSIATLKLPHVTHPLTHSWMYCSKKGEALRLSTGQSKKPWISFWCRSIVMTCVRPDLHIIFASSLVTIQPRFLILPVQNTSSTCLFDSMIQWPAYNLCNLRFSQQ
jgi:hypothetical protein